MFKSARWRGEKNRTKAVFKLQFHATQVLQSWVAALTLSIIPGDVGKPSARLERATVRDGSCTWENPVYETVNFVRDPKTGKISERIYYFAVSTGLSKASFFAEVSIDFADYAEATKPSAVSLPLKNSHCDAVLHVQIQRLQENADHREVEEYDDVKITSHDRTSKTYLSNGDSDEGIKNNSTEDASTKGTAQRVQLTANCRSSSGSDITLFSSESNSELTTPRELRVRKATVHQGPTDFDSSLSHTPEPHIPVANASTPVCEEHQRSHWGWSAGSDHDLSTDGSTNSSHAALPRQISQQSSDIVLEKLKAELTVLVRQVDVSDLELQTLRKQIVKESKRGQDLSKEIISLKEEKDAFQLECEKLKSFQKRMDEAKLRNRSQLESGDLRTLVEEIRQELAYEKDLNANLRLQLQKTQESNAELILAVQDLDEMLEQKNMEISNLSNKLDSCKNSQELRGKISKCGTDDDKEQMALEELVKEHSNAKETLYHEQKFIDLCSELEVFRRDKDELEMQMEQLALDYEILKQENHDITYQLKQSQLQEQLKLQYESSSPAASVNGLESDIESLEHELKKQSKELSDSLSTVKELETHIKSLEEELQKQAQGFEADLDAVTCAKVEQEQRAIQAEEALRKTRLKNANTAERLQEEFRQLSFQMASTFDANEKVAMKALSEASELRAQKIQLEEMLQDLKEALQSVKAGYESKLHELSYQIDMKTYQIEQMLLEIEDRSKQLEHLEKYEEEITWNFSQEIRILKADNERLAAEITCLSQHAERKEIFRADLEHMKKSIKESEFLIESGKIERNELVSTIALVKKEAEKSVEEINRMRRLKDEKETVARSLQSELETIKTQYTDLKHSLFEDEIEKEKLRKQVFQLKGEIKKKEETITNTEKKIKDSYGRIAFSDGSKSTSKNKKSAPVAHSLKEVASLRERIKNLEGQIKLKEVALETSATSFFKKEKDLQSKIKQLESRVEEFHQRSTLQKVDEDSSFSTSKGSRSLEVRSTTRYLNGTTTCECDENGDAMPSIQRDDSLGDLLTELASLKERNKSMEGELKEMQERYSEISLKFAEVEGERQKLIMTVRNLKNTRRANNSFLIS